MFSGVKPHFLKDAPTNVLFLSGQGIQRSPLGDARDQLGSAVGPAIDTVTESIEM